MMKLNKHKQHTSPLDHNIFDLQVKTELNKHKQQT